MLPPHANVLWCQDTSFHGALITRNLGSIVDHESPPSIGRKLLVSKTTRVAIRGREGGIYSP